MGGGSTPSAKLHFGLPDLTGSRAKTSKAYTNPFASPSKSCKEAGLAIKAQGEAMEGWTFQGRRRHTPKLASPRHEALQPPSRTPQWEATPGGKRGLSHSEIHPSFFTALGIPVLANKEPFRTKIWPVLTREKNAQKETLVHSKNQAPPSLPLSIRFSGPMEIAEAEWAPSSAWSELMQRIELKLKEKDFKIQIQHRRSA